MVSFLFVKLAVLLVSGNIEKKEKGVELKLKFYSFCLISRKMKEMKRKWFSVFYFSFSIFHFINDHGFFKLRFNFIWRLEDVLFHVTYKFDIN